MPWSAFWWDGKGGSFRCGFFFVLSLSRKLWSVKVVRFVFVWSERACYKTCDIVYIQLFSSGVLGGLKQPIQALCSLCRQHEMNRPCNHKYKKKRLYQAGSWWTRLTKAPVYRTFNILKAPHIYNEHAFVIKRPPRRLPIFLLPFTCNRIMFCVMLLDPR